MAGFLFSFFARSTIRGMCSNFERWCSCAVVVKKRANHDDRSECEAGSSRSAALSVVRALASGGATFGAAI